MTAPTNQQRDAFIRIASAIIDTVKEMGEQGAPAGIMYAALMGYGCSLNQFESIMSILVRAGKLTKHGDLYFHPLHDTLRKELHVSQEINP